MSRRHPASPDRRTDENTTRSGTARVVSDDGSDPNNRIFVYGILRTAGAAPLGTVIQQPVRSLGPGKFQGTLYDLGDYPGAIPSQDGSREIIGEVFEIPSPRDAFQILDSFEGSEYRRCIGTVTLDSGEGVPAWLYLLDQTQKPKRLVSGGDWILHKKL